MLSTLRRNEYEPEAESDPRAEALMTENPEGRPDFAALYDRNFAKVYNYVRCRVGDAAAADDVVSRAFERALDRLDSFDSRAGTPEAWLFAIARNAVVDHFRARRWLSWLPLELLAERPGRDERGEDLLAADESRRGLLRALERLGARERDIVALKFGAGMTNREIAALSGLGESNIGVILHRAVKKLHAALKGEP